MTPDTEQAKIDRPPVIFATNPEAAAEQTAAAPVEPQRGKLWAVRSLDRAGRVRTKLFRQQPAALRHARYLEGLGYRPSMFVAPVGKWKPVHLETWAEARARRDRERRDRRGRGEVVAVIHTAGPHAGRWFSAVNGAVADPSHGAAAPLHRPAGTSL